MTRCVRSSRQWARVVGTISGRRTTLSSSSMNTESERPGGFSEFPAGRCSDGVGHIPSRCAGVRTGSIRGRPSGASGVDSPIRMVNAVGILHRRERMMAKRENTPCREPPDSPKEAEFLPYYATRIRNPPAEFPHTVTRGRARVSGDRCPGVPDPLEKRFLIWGIECQYGTMAEKEPPRGPPPRPYMGRAVSYWDPCREYTAAF